MRKELELLEIELLELKIGEVVRRAEDAVATLREAGIETVSFYVRQQQERVIAFLESIEIRGGFLFVMRPNSEIAFHPGEGRFRGTAIHPDPALAGAATASGVTISVRSEFDITGAKVDPRIAVFGYFEPWDWVVVAMVNEREVFRTIGDLRFTSILAAAVVIIITGTILLTLSRSVARPVNVLKEATTRVAEGDLDTRVPLLGKTEFGDLSRFFNGMVERLQRYATELEEMVSERTLQLQEVNAQLSARNDDLTVANAVIQSKNQHIEHSIRYARRIQESMLPSHRGIVDLIPESLLLNRPKDVLSGDFYWCARIRTGVLVCVADCMGHGVPGALGTSIAITQLRRIVYDEKIDDLGAILTKLHERLVESASEIGSIDALLLCLPDATDSGADYISVVFASAHRPLFIADGEGIEEIDGDRYAVASRRAHNHPGYESRTIHVKRGSMFYLTTDGAVDQLDADGHRIGTKRITEFFRELAGSPCTVQQSRLDEYFDESIRASGQRDDITALGIRVGSERGFR